MYKEQNHQYVVKTKFLGLLLPCKYGLAHEHLLVHVMTASNQLKEISSSISSCVAASGTQCVFFNIQQRANEIYFKLVQAAVTCSKSENSLKFIN